VENNNRTGAFVEEEIDLAQYWRVISRRKWSILALACLITLLAGLIVFSITPVYKATATLLIEPQQAKLPSIEDLYGLAGKDKQYYLTQLEMLKSRKLAEVVIDQLLLMKNTEFVPLKDAVSYNPLNLLRTWLASMGVSDDEADKVDHTRDLVVAAFQGRLHVALIKDTQMITVEFESESAVLAARIANALAKAYIDDQLGSRVEMTRQATGWLEQRLKVLKANLQVSERSLQDYMEKNHLVDVKGVGTLTAKELEDLTTKMVDARAKYSELSKRYGARHPKMIAARSELEASKRELSRGKTRIQSIGRKEVQLRELQRQVDSNRQLYDTFLSRLKEASQAVDLQAANARVSDPAVAPIAPFKPKKRLILALAFFASLMMGVLLAFLHEALDKTIKRADEIEAKLGLPLLGILPLIKSNRKNRSSQAFAMLDENQASYAEAMRTIRTGLVLSSLDNPHKVILVTSSIPGEGKTTVATNLAAAMATMEKVLLIGADLRRPQLERAIGMDGKQAGMSDILAETAELRDCMYRVEKANFDVLPCGQIPPNPLEMLSSERFARLLGLLEQAYDRIIIDSPPVQAVSDSLVLSRYAKAVVYVVEADNTHEHAVINGIKRLRDQQAPLAGVVLNKVDVANAKKYGYDYTGYYDHYGYSEKS